MVVNEIGRHAIGSTSWVLDQASIWQRRSNLQGKVFNVAYIVDGMPYIGGISEDQSTVTGFFGKMLVYLARRLNFTMQFKVRYGCSK